MPELPEVTTIVRELNEHGVACLKIKKASVFWPSIIATSDDLTFCDKIKGQVIEKIERRGKFLVFTLSEDTLLVHLRMTGKFSIIDSKERTIKHEHVRLTLSDNRALRYEDSRKFGRWYLLKDPSEKLSDLGIEPLSEEFTVEVLKEKLLKSTLQIKAFLLNQQHIAGIGNIYADEALWDAKLHPLRKASSLKKQEIKSLHLAIPKVLNLGIANKGTSLGSSRANYYSVSGRRGENQDVLKVFRQDGSPCPRCKSPIIKIRVAQRGTHLCPSCQV